MEYSNLCGHCCWEVSIYPRDPGSPSENVFMEPKYYAFRFGDWTPLAPHLRILRLMPRVYQPF